MLKGGYYVCNAVGIGEDVAQDLGLMLWWYEIPRISACRILIAEGSSESIEKALDNLKQYDQENKRVYNSLQRIEIQALMAM